LAVRNCWSLCVSTSGSRKSAARKKSASALLTQTPALLQEVMDSFEPHSMDAEISSVDGGAQFNTELGQTLVEYLEDQQLTRAEALYALVAVLRAVKVGQCVLNGPDTGMLAEIMGKGVQVCLV